MMTNLKFTLLFIFASFMLLGCNSTTKKSKNEADITEISYSKTVGRGGSVKITATKDSLISTHSGTAFQDIPEVNKKIKSEDWNELISALDISTIKKTNSGPARGHYDGPDETFEFTTSTENYSLLNVSDPEKYKQLENLTVLLKKMVSKK